MRKRIFAAFVCLCMLMALVPSMAYANDTVYTGGLCEHHTQHDDACGYSEGTAEIPCSHEHNESCGGLTNPTACNHTHDEACGYAPAIEGTPCTFVCEVCNAQDSGNQEALSNEQTEECTCETLCTGEEINADCPVRSAEGAELDKVCVGAALLLTAPTLRTGEIKLFIGGQQITESGCYANQNGTWTKVGGTGPSSGQFYYDAATATLTLNGATIQGGTSTGSVPYGAGIYAQCSNGQSVTLTIKLIGENTITGYYGIYVNAEISENSNGTDASLTITGENNVSLEVSGSFYGIFVKSGTGNASVTIENASVDAKTTQTNSGYAGVCVQSGASSKDSPNLSLAVNGGSLTASGTGNSDGIQFVVGSHQATGATTSLSVTNNAIVDARNGGISASRTSVTLPTPTPTGNNSSGIVFDDKNGTVYGNVTLQEDLNIGEGENLTIGKDASLTIPDGKTLTNNGTILVSGGTLSGGTTLTTPNITEQPTGQTVTAGETAEFSVTASADNGELTYQWQQSTDSGSSWANIESATSAKYTTEATTTSMSGYQYRCVVKSASGVGVISQAATLTVNKGVSPTSYSISANVAPAGAGTVKVNGSGTSTTVEANSNVTLTATANEGYRFTGWTSSGDGTFGNASSAETTFTMPAGNVTVTAQFAKVVTGVKLDKEALGLRTGGSATLTATVQPSDATNQNVTWQSDNANVATVQNGTVTAVGAGETTITVQTQDGNYTATCKVTVTQRSSGSSNTPVEYNLRFDTNGGDAMSTIVKQANTAIDLDKYVPTRDGYKFVGWYADEDLTKPIDEITLTQSTTIYAKWEKIEEEEQEETTEQEETAVSFTDVRERDWFYKAVSYAVEHGLMSGMGDGTFSPNTPLQREMFATVLWNLEGNPAPKDVAPFLDVTSDKYYADAIAWTSENGIVAGFGDTFGAGVPITREQFAVMLHNYARYKGYDTTQGGMAVREFSDYENISDYARPAMAWAVNAGIMGGMDDGTLMPQGKATRAEAATMLMNFCENMVEK